MKIIVCDDDEVQSKQMKNMLTEYFKDYPVDVEAFSNGSSLVEYLKYNEGADVYFLDVEMPKLNGIEVGNIIRKNDYRALIIFVTGHDEYVMEMFGLHAYDYIKKPIDNVYLVKLLSNIVNYFEISQRDFYYSFNREQYSISMNKIIAIQRNNHATTMYTTEGVIEFYESFDNVAKRLPDNLFVQIRSKCIVNMTYINKISKEIIEINYEDEKIPSIYNVSRNYYHKLLDGYSKYISDSTWRKQ